MKGLACQQNRHQKVFYRGGFTFVKWGLKLCFGGTKPTKAPSRGDGTVWQKFNFSLLFNAIN